MALDSRSNILLVLAVVGTMASMSSEAAVGGKPVYAAPNRSVPFSNRVVVKLKPSPSERAMSAQQRIASLSRPLAIAEVQQLQTMAGAPMRDLHALGTGAHVMTLEGVRDAQTVGVAIAAMRKLSNVEYVEEDSIETIQALPNDPYYVTGPTGSPGLWALFPVAPVASPAPGVTGSYGANFQPAWVSSTGTGVVVAVVDSGITAHQDIVGPGGVVAAGAGSNLASSGYDFITDCRLRGTTSTGGCPATTPTGSEYVAPSPGASDTGDYIDAADCTTPGSVFNTVGCTPFPSSWHGTHVAGIIAAIGNNGIGVIGGAYGAKILPVRALGKGGGYSTDVSEAILWAAGVHPSIPNPNPAKVINLSTGALSPLGCPQHRQNAINAAVNAGAVVVVAAGNDAVDVANSISANCSNVISVAAVARDGSRASYSNFSSPASNTTNPTRVTLAAPGGEMVYPVTFDPGILSTVDVGTTVPAGSGYAYMQGTSMATPYVSAAVALMLSYNPALTPARVKQILSNPAALTPFPSFTSASGLAPWDCSLNGNCGAGMLNVQLALQNSTTTAPAATSSSGGGGGGCSLMPLGADPDVSLLLAMLAVAGYWFHRRIARGRSAA